MEIERKYLIAKLPDHLEQYEHLEIEQAYLCTSPMLNSTAIHNREEEFQLSEESYNRLLAKCDSGHVAKTRYRIDLAKQTGNASYTGLTAELDVFHGRHEGLLLVEVEFPNTESANSFTPPDWFGEDVSSDPCFRNSFLASMP